MNVQRTNEKSDTTPPGSLIEQPLTPPPSKQKLQASEEERIIDEITRGKTGCDYSEVPWQRYNLSSAAFQRIEKHFQNDYSVQYKLRFDYFPSTRLFVLRMPAPIHEQIAASIVSEIVLQLHSISKGEGAASIFAKSVSSSGSTTIKSDDPELSRHDPDGSFKHEQAYSPGVILEVSYSQKRKDLLRLAEDYIYGSDGNTRVVVGIDVDYNDKSATLLMWQSQIQTNEAGEKELVAHQMSNQKFRKENGEVNPEAELRLHLEDFAHPSFSKHTTFGKDISISSTVLCTYLHKAEQAQVINKQKLGYIPLEPGLKKRKRRSITPPEVLKTDDESRYQKEEERATEKRSREDSDYHENRVLGVEPAAFGAEFAFKMRG